MMMSSLYKTVSFFRPPPPPGPIGRGNRPAAAVCPAAATRTAGGKQFSQTNQLNTIYIIQFNNHFLPLPTCKVILVIASAWLFKPLSAPLHYSLQKATIP
jgi:hypothetical protein